MPPTTTTATKAQLIPAPSRPDQIAHPQASVFLAGSTSSAGPDWRAAVTSSLSGLPVTIYDPARADWDSSWRETPDFAPWREQVAWELEMQEAAAVVVVWFAADTKAPISLLELGLVARQRQGGTGAGAGATVGGEGEEEGAAAVGRSKAVVVCPRGYWKEGNVRMVCERYGVEVVDVDGDGQGGVGVEGLVECLRRRFGMAEGP